ncbi:uncharacterized protein B0T15DRAFT_555878 [Chaetomium strumarium]|uniref:DUF676 domain-containing protein n=1 Tax=Chaetomium strumarium TaxID=1170767 RepID=A0AAJ0M1J7_9PEZI|nr:hypothetical protein B0T15DRAFT_555878 [Chaetomium strumarium]
MFNPITFVTQVLVNGPTAVASLVRNAAAGLKTFAANLSLKGASAVFAAADNEAIVDTVFKVVQRSIAAFTGSLSGAALIWNFIFTNGINQETKDFILNNLGDLKQFLYDLVRPGTVIPGPQTPGVTGAVNQYNELDLSVKENREAVVYQLQRVSLTLMTILRLGRARRNKSSLNLSDIEMNVELSSDFRPNGQPPDRCYTAKWQEPGSPQNYKETWLFVNGIANEHVWFRRSCDKIKKRFKTDVTGVYNRSDGILWDFIECTGERSPAAAEASHSLIQRTDSSMKAQNALDQELKRALSVRDDNHKVVVIAHSQGCLLLRLVLQALVNRPEGVSELRERTETMEIMRKSLNVFTFGNPSVDWCVVDDSDARRSVVPLSNFVLCTEHFAHATDFVARLGVMRHGRGTQGAITSGYNAESVFRSKDGRGHLFGAHYSLDKEDYDEGENTCHEHLTQ